MEEQQKRRKQASAPAVEAGASSDAPTAEVAPQQEALRADLGLLIPEAKQRAGGPSLLPKAFNSVKPKDVLIGVTVAGQIFLCVLSLNSLHDRVPPNQRIDPTLNVVQSYSPPASTRGALLLSLTDPAGGDVFDKMERRSAMAMEYRAMLQAAVDAGEAPPCPDGGCGGARRGVLDVFL